MRRILYWSSLILAAILLAYISPFNLTPIIFLGGASCSSGFFISFIAAAVPVWGGTSVPFRRQLNIYVWFIDDRRAIHQRERAKRILCGTSPTFRKAASMVLPFIWITQVLRAIDSPELNKLIAEKTRERVLIVLEVVKDFGKLRLFG
jgi:hypothetical protein